MTDKPITAGQAYSLSLLIGRVNEARPAQIWIASKLAGRDIDALDDLTLGEWQTIRDRAYPHWTDGDWEPGAEFVVELHRLNNQYQTEVLGQLTLF